MGSYIVNKDSSLVAVNSIPYIVYLSTTSEVGQIITVRDVDGLISYPQSAIISTVGCTLTDGLSTLYIRQKFGYFTLKSLSPSLWTIINSSAFQDPTQDYTTKGVSFIRGTVENLQIGNYVSSASLIQGNTLLTRSNASINILNVSSLVVNNSSLGPYVANINGNLFNSGSLTIQGTLINTGVASLFQSLTVNNGISSFSSVLIQGTLNQSTNSLFNVQKDIVSRHGLLINNTLTSGNLIASTTTINRSLNAQNVSNVQTSAVRVNISSMYLSATSYIISRADISVVDPSYTGSTNPVVEIQQGLSAFITLGDRLVTSNLAGNIVEIGSVFSTSISSFIMSNATINNANGSLNISSIQTGVIITGRINNNSSISTVGLNNGSLSNLYFENRLITSDLRGENINTDLCIGNSVYTNSLNLGNTPITSVFLTLSTINVSSEIIGSMSSINIPNALITARTLQTSTINSINTETINMGPNLYEINSGNLPLYMLSPLINISTSATVQSNIDSISTNISSIYCRSIEFGAPLSYSTINPGALYLIPSTISGSTSNTPYDYVSGLGTTYSPLTSRAFNSKVLYMYLGNISSFSTSYINVSMNYVNNGSSNGNAGFRIRNSATYSTLISFNASPIQGIQRATLSNYPVDRNFNPVQQQYYLTNLNTPPIRTDATHILVATGIATGGASLLYSSDSGVTWMNPQNSIFSAYASGVAASDLLWVATGSGTANTLAYSYNGLLWYGANKTIFTTEGFCAAWNGRLWIAGGSGTNTLAYSYDGISWVGLGTSIFTGAVKGIAWNGLQWIAVGSGTNTLAYSYDGLAWSAGVPVFSVEGRGVAWGQDKWVVVGSGTSTLAYSYDGLTWTPISGLFSGGGACVAWNGSTWIAGGSGTYPLLYSTTGTIWSISTSPFASVQAVAWSTNWVITGSSGSFATSSNGVFWTLSNSTYFGGGTGTSLAVQGSLMPLVNEASILYTSGPNYTLAYSIGGITWSLVNSLISGIATSIVWNGSSLWLGSMSSGSDTLIYSYDGINWSGLGQIIFSSRSNQVATNGYIWVATGNGSNSLAYSYDGLTWVGLGNTIFTEGFGVAWAQGRFVATGSGSTWAAISLDGINWTPSSSTLFTVAHKLAFGNNLWVATGVNNGTSSLAYSSNGLTWTAVTPNPFSISAYDVAMNGSTWLAIGSGAVNNVAYSTDGMTWTGINVANISAKGLTWATNAWFLTGATSGDPVVFKSFDGITWVSASSTFFGPAYTLASKQVYPYGTVRNGLTIACGNNTLVISADGISWIPLSTPLVTGYCVLWNGALWVAGGTGTNVIAYSNDGVNWTSGTLSGPSAINAVAWSNGLWIAVGEGSKVWATSPDGITWTSYLGGAGGFFTGPAYGILGGVGGWIAAGTGGLLFSSTGASWSAIGTGLFSTGRAVQTNGKQLLALGSGSNTMAYSYNGLAWTGLGLSTFSVRGNGAVFGKNLWVAVGEGINTIAVSNDGLVWTGLGLTTFSVRGSSVAWNGTLFIATGEGTNTLATSSDGYTWTGLGSTVFTGAGYSANTKFSGNKYPIIEPRPYTWRSVGYAAATSQTSIQKFSNTTAWDSAVYSQESYSESVYLTFSPTGVTGRLMMGLSESPINTTPTQLNYAFELNAGQVSIYEIGFQVKAFPAYSVGDIFTILYNGTQIQYYWNSTLLRTVSRPTQTNLHMMCILFNSLNTLNNIDFHGIYKFTAVSPSPSISSFVASIVPGPSVSFSAPLYLTLTSDLTPSLWTFNISASGTLSNTSTSLYADVYINETKYWSTNVISNISLTSSATYSLYFNVLSPYTYTPGDTLNFRLRGSRSLGTSYIYGNWLSSNGTGLSSSLVYSSANPNAVEYLEFFHTSANALQTSEISVSLSDVSTNTVSYINSNVGLVMNQSYINWGYPLNGVTIANNYNDTQTRSLLYTGALYNASDSNLKHSIEYVDTAPYLTAIQDLPLKRYSFNKGYISTFSTTDNKQLGILTSELPFSSMILSAPFEHLGLSSIQTVDRTQFRYAHLATTQALIGRISTLKSILETT
jgi:hypothetical protein